MKHLKVRTYTHPYECKPYPYIYEHLRETESKKLIRRVFRLTKSPHAPLLLTRTPFPTEEYSTLYIIHQIKCETFHLALGYLCSHHPKNIFTIVKKILQNVSHVHLDNLCAFIQLHEKQVFFMVDVKNRKYVS